MLSVLEHTTNTRKKRTVFVALAFLALGFPPLVNSLDNPRLAGLRGPDILRLIAIGLCVGLALGVFFVGVFFVGVFGAGRNDTGTSAPRDERLAKPGNGA